MISRCSVATRILVFLAALTSCSHSPETQPEALQIPQLPRGAIRSAEPKLKLPDLLEDPETNPAQDTDPLVEELLSSLTLRQRIGQRFISHVPGTRLQYGAGRAIVEVAPAGFILYPWNFSTADDVRELTASLDRFARSITPGVGLLICADQEGGRVQAFRFPSIASIPSAATMGELAESVGFDHIEAAAYLTGVQLLNLGLNMNLAPVLDVFGGDPGSIIGDRSYSGIPQIVSRAGAAYLAGANRSGIISVAKHFPGHGISTIDSHHALPVVTESEEVIRSIHLAPFAAAITDGVEVIMTAHVLYEAVDPQYPASLSRIFLQDVLRDELGFGGVVMSDGLEMGALRNNYDLTESLVRMFRYDVDLILLFVSDDVVEIVDRVEDLVASGLISADDVDRGARRVLQLKLRHGIAGFPR